MKTETICGLNAYPFTIKGEKLVIVVSPTDQFYTQVKNDGRLYYESKKKQGSTGIPDTIAVSHLIVNGRREK